MPEDGKNNEEDCHAHPGTNQQHSVSASAMSALEMPMDDKTGKETAIHLPLPHQQAPSQFQEEK